MIAIRFDEDNQPYLRLNNAHTVRRGYILTDDKLAELWVVTTVHGDRVYLQPLFGWRYWWAKGQAHLLRAVGRVERHWRL